MKIKLNSRKMVYFGTLFGAVVGAANSLAVDMLTKGTFVWNNNTKTATTGMVWVNNAAEFEKTCFIYIEPLAQAPYYKEWGVAVAYGNGVMDYEEVLLQTGSSVASWTVSSCQSLMFVK